MASGRFKVVLTGELQGGRDPAEVRAALQQLFGLGAEEVARLLDSAPVAVKSGLDYDKAAKYKAAIEQTGARCDLREEKDADAAPMSVQPASAAVPAPPPPATSGGEDWSRAEAAPPPATEAPAGAPHAPRRLAPGRAVGWLGDAWGMFTAAPVAWVLLWVCFFAVMFLALMIPVLNFVAGFLLPPLLTGGAMFAAHTQRNGGAASVGQLFEGFSRRPGPLLGIGGIYLLLTIVLAMAAGVLGVVFGLGGAIMGQAGMGGAAPMDPGFAVFASGGAFVFALLMIALSCAVYAAIWFAPALVILDGLGAVDACKQSFRGCLANWLLFVIYAILLVLLTVVAMIPLGLGLLLLGPVVVLSMYIGYREIFVD